MPLPFSFSADHLAKQGGSFEPLRSFNGSLTIYDGEFDGLTLAVEAFPLPKESNQILTLRRGAEVVKLPGPASVADVDVTVRDFVAPNVYRELYVWRRSVYMPSAQAGGPAAIENLGTANRTFPLQGGVGRARNIKRRGTLRLYRPNGVEHRRYLLTGLWPASLDAGDVDYTSEDLIKIKVTFACDFFAAVEFVPVEGF